jgi:hypothetical protein
MKVWGAVPIQIQIVHQLSDLRNQLQKMEKCKVHNGLHRPMLHNSDHKTMAMCNNDNLV